MGSPHPTRRLVNTEFCICFGFETESQYVAQAGLELEILLPQPPECWDCGVHHYAWLTNIRFKRWRRNSLWAEVVWEGFLKEVTSQSLACGFY
jgi:hypothetical protein